MRVKHKPWAKDRLQEFPAIYIENPEELKGKWQEVFGNNNPIHIEIGSGKGQFVSGMAKANPSINYIGIEMIESVLVSALDKALEADVPNLRLVARDAKLLEDCFEKGEIAQIYLNFSDPWPKKRHTKRRLTNPTFLAIYERLLPTDGEIHFKTDNRSLFEYSLVAFSEYNMLLTFVSLDLHNSDYEGNIKTEYEEKFSAKGFPIYRLEAKFGRN
ncbi:tRNA (guanosine(46)-N7)-methyltransferase TrmB [Listeria ivanovii]|uniref:tRNA (guanine-N(7)-)-methyltransferase n=1 Tax=Listeria ivanovii (strain ATCC BAA-678 / PAM 55) TaxID=881621 RepID=G2ZA93_LISIP|nr:tRNA (guanosine(46)-N7)-methyltransferase TrmB [Listeria ivanovii]AHI56117.1 tRNA (guanine-N(7)-)-methyltransferase [Listeria ivanovii WSLC3009]AIS65552.1 tRNA (guanine-N7)-methyltransferase [Listeria ivanovii subsp. ivanovii]MBC1759469.1 tRNA (guanosine(46)-N7)-methyltransferase TrmB [Listeria ivanovii]MBK3914281.1 tRNA (guanosine(46)-N7)-methyltransferase TrmB [Listeria ivanovii subsp. ivanovii]MBK3921820.1 tRNA (guanosine(46)-N7)-methyltransferase TrmB [Listeria ivanovii subsp. ivanovii]